jgi:hypothetical protein
MRETGAVACLKKFASIPCTTADGSHRPIGYNPGALPGAWKLEDRLLDLIYGAVADPTRWSEVLIGVSDHLGAVGGMLAYVPPPGSKKPISQILGRMPEEASAIFREQSSSSIPPRNRARRLLRFAPPMD